MFLGIAQLNMDFPLVENPKGLHHSVSNMLVNIHERVVLDQRKTLGQRFMVDTNRGLDRISNIPSTRLILSSVLFINAYDVARSKSPDGRVSKWLTVAHPNSHGSTVGDLAIRPTDCDATSK